MSEASSSICQDYYRGVHIGCSGTTETACSAETGGVITSGGGFSNYYTRPSYQANSVQAYLSDITSALPPVSFFNASGRGYPDISGYAHNYPVIMNGAVSPESGTSASTPLIAALITLWNDIRLTYNQPVLGFINPLLYQIAAQHPEAFNDVSTGDNRCLVHGIPCCQNGFKATRGWDPVTGLGTPKFVIISNLMIDPTAAVPFANFSPRGRDGTNGTNFSASSPGFVVLLIVSIIAMITSCITLYRLHSLYKKPNSLQKSLADDY